MNYTQTLDYLFSRLPMFQRSGPAAYKNNLENTLHLDKLYGHPHKKFKSIHVAGTNGKGSVSHMLASVLQSAGYKTGLYTSPHLKDFRERIKINGQMISQDDVVSWVENYQANNELWKIEPSFFELTVAMAFDYFAQQKVDVAVVEVGLGGRLDSTNIITPEVSIITNIGLDHTNLLGNTLPDIALEKAGIIKVNVPVIIGTSQNKTKAVFTSKATEKNAKLFFADQEYNAVYSMLTLDGKQTVHIEKHGRHIFPELKLDVLGAYQLKNLPVVFKSFEILQKKGWNISTENIYKGLESTIKQTALHGRWQVLGHNPQIVCDTGHNADGIKMIVEQIENTAYKSLHFIFGTVEDKNPDNILELLPKNAEYYFTSADIPRAMNEEELAKKAAEFRLPGNSYSSVKDALKAAKRNASANDLIFIGGSTFVVAEVL